MKPNQEISLKFWIAMIVFFAVVLSIPLMNSLVEKSIISYADIAGFYFVCFVSALCFYMILVLRHSELKQKLSKETFFNKVSAQTITDYDNQIKAQELHINDIKQAFEDAVAEINELKSKISALKEVNNMLLKSGYETRLKIKKNRDENNDLITYWKERALHQKHTKKEVKYDMWEYIGHERYNQFCFVQGNKYEVNASQKLSFDRLIYLIGENGASFIVEKKYFKPVKC